jgi:hypothetical protein
MWRSMSMRSRLGEPMRVINPGFHLLGSNYERRGSTRNQPDEWGSSPAFSDLSGVAPPLRKERRDEDGRRVAWQCFSDLSGVAPPSPKASGLAVLVRGVRTRQKRSPYATRAAPPSRPSRCAATAGMLAEEAPGECGRKKAQNAQKGSAPLPSLSGSWGGRGRRRRQGSGARSSLSRRLDRRPCPAFRRPFQRYCRRKS